MDYYRPKASGGGSLSATHNCEISSEMLGIHHWDHFPSSALGSGSPRYQAIEAGSDLGQ